MGWKCIKCFRENPSSSKECESINCNQWRPRNQIPKRKGDWQCCQETQFASRNKCRKCNKPKHGRKKEEKEDIAVNIVFRVGDWLCPKCNDHQFQNRTYCRKCETSRPVKEDEDGNDIGNPCVVCYSNERNVAFVHGDTGHFVCCKECAKMCKKCPMCRADVDKIINIY